MSKLVTSFEDYQWHPAYKSFVTFNHITTVLNKLKQELSNRSLEYPKKNSTGTYEITIFNKFHPKNYGEAYYWVETHDIENWWPNNDDMDLLRKYGWIITFTLKSQL
jgi:hypothetical protein